MGNVRIAIVRFCNSLLHLLGLRKRHRYWGVVYDSVTKQPIDPAIVKLVHVNSGRAVETCITDMTGRYGFLAHPGVFKILVQRTNYSFPSQRQPGKKDGVYEDLYHGEFLDLGGDSDVVALNIPMDPIQADWNQEAKLNVVKAAPFVEYLAFVMIRLIFWFWFVLLIALYVSTRQDWVHYVLGLYGVIFLIAIFTPDTRLWGLVRKQGTGEPVNGALVELCHPDIPDIVIAKTHTSEEGKFFLRANPGKYNLRLKDSQNQVLFTRRVRVHSEGVVNSNYYV